MFLNVKFVEIDRVYVKFVEGQKNGNNSKLLPILIYEGTNFLYFYPQFLFSIEKRKKEKS